MRVVTRYLSWRFIRNFVLMLVGMAALSLTFELMEEADQVLTSADGNVMALLRYSALRLPDIFSQMVPIAALLGALLTLGILMHHRELVAIWGSGISIAGVMRALLPIGLILVVVQFSLKDQAVPASLVELRAWGVGNFERGGFTHGLGQTVWLRSGADIIAVPAESAREGRLTNLRIFRRDQDGMLIEQIDAGDARRDGEIWILTDVTITTIDPPAITNVPTLAWDGRIDLGNMGLLSRDLKELPINQIWNLVENEGYGQRPPNLFRTWFQYRIASAISPLMMILLVVSLAQRFQRTGTFTHLMFFSVVIGFGAFVFENASLAMGESGFLPPWIAAWSPNLVLACVIGAFVANAEG